MGNEDAGVAGEVTAPPRVFISYAHDSESHREKVRGEEPEQLAEIYSLPAGEIRHAVEYERRRNELSAA